MWERYSYVSGCGLEITPNIAHQKAVMGVAIVDVQSLKKGYYWFAGNVRQVSWQ